MTIFRSTLSTVLLLSGYVHGFVSLSQHPPHQNSHAYVLPKSASGLEKDGVLAESQPNETERSLRIESFQCDDKLLDQALDSDPIAASSIIKHISQLQGSEREVFLSTMLRQIDSITPFWCKFSLATKFSRRARKAALKRVLDMSIPISSEKDILNKESNLRTRCRSLVTVIRSLSDFYEGDLSLKTKRPAIASIEKMSRREIMNSLNVQHEQERLQRIPRDLETPIYTVIAKRKLIEIRRYEPFSVCSVSMSQARPEKSSDTDAKVSNPQIPGASSFGALAGYLFGKNQEKQAMKMTTPVFSSGSDESRLMSFVLPSEFWQVKNFEKAPQPLEGSGVTLELNEGSNRAVIMFGGFASKKDVTLRTQQLLNAIKSDKDWKADPSDSVSLAQYNDPFTPPWKRLNEVSIKVIAERA
jgi:SOUL heme-binding protein